jgi:hypothetical protein
VQVIRDIAPRPARKIAIQIRACLDDGPTLMSIRGAQDSVSNVFQRDDLPASCAETLAPACVLKPFSWHGICLQDPSGFCSYP